ncbi:hypothetical protein GYA27_04825 [candidate division WWE3 bacterium]|uniref:Uncharacterized protein n=1 Tax=candidate division WWE3 bacterium TaxID=2053526 RepID=A0A7X9DL75_UNCKA|nr:hypothetical protein [candidate division WWE3 bacterium]
MLKTILFVYFGIGLAFALFNIIRNTAPWKTLLFNTLAGPIILILMFRDAIKRKNIKIGE